MRRAISFACAIGLMAGGAAFLYMQVFQANVISFGIVLGAGTACGFGALWLWEEIIDPTK